MSLNYGVIINIEEYIGGEPYKLSILPDGSKEAKTIFPSRSQLGFNFVEVISLLNIDSGSSYPSGLQIGYEWNIESSTLIYTFDVSVEGTREVKKYIRKGKNIASIDSEIRTINYQYDILPSFVNSGTWASGEIIVVDDGDTIKIRVDESSGDIKKFEKDITGKAAEVGLIGHGDVIEIRFVGINCAEVMKSDEAMETERRNEDFLKLHGIVPNEDTLKMAYQLGNEAKEFVDRFLGMHCTIEVDTGNKNNGWGPGFDVYGRCLAMIYIDIKDLYDSRGSSYEEIRSRMGIKSPLNCINLNKTVLATKSKTDPNFNLADLYLDVVKDYKTGKLTSKFPLLSWTVLAAGYDKKIDLIDERMDRNNTKPHREAFLKEHNLHISSDGFVEYNDTYVAQIGYSDHEVKTGDTWAGLAILGSTKAHTLSAQDLANVNGISLNEAILTDNPAYRMQIGSKIKIPKYRTITGVSNEQPGETTDLYVNNTNIIPSESETEEYKEAGTAFGEGQLIDDRDILDGVQGDYTPYGAYYMRIGDCMLPVSPLSIKVDTLSSSQRVQPLRSKSSIQTQTGYSSKIITVDLFFANLEDVNGVETKSPIPWDAPYYRNGLLPLIAQFKRAPFLPIDNELLNFHFQIFSVALKDITISTIPGFPNCMQAKLELYEFDHQSYMFEEEYFSGTFCWPLYRWYYQRIMQPSQPGERTLLKPIKELGSQITFFLPDEGMLVERQKAISDLYNKIDPVRFEEVNTKEGSTSDIIKKDAESLRNSIALYNRFKSQLGRYPESTYPKLYKNGYFYPHDIVSLDPLRKEEHLVALYNIFLDMGVHYETLIKENKFYIDFVPNNLAEAYLLDKNVDKIIDSTVIRALFPQIPYEDGMYVEFNTSNSGDGMILYNSSKIKLGTTDAAQAQRLGPRKDMRTAIQMLSYGYQGDGFGDSIIKVDHPSGGLLLTKLIFAGNINRIDNELNKPSPIQAYFISPTDSIRIAMIIDVHEDIQVGFIDNKIEWEKLNFLAHSTEQDIAIEPFLIPDMIVENISAQMHNNYAPLQLNGLEMPTFQYLGSSDISVDINIRTKNRETVSRLQQLMSTAQRLSREYRIAITSGVVTIENNIFNLLGVRSVLIERISVETSSQDKESFNINMTLTAFDKTQRLKEDFQAANLAGDMETWENFEQYAKMKRNKEGYEYASIDFKLKDLEVYPDLELPTFDEVNAAIPHLNLKFYDKSDFTHIPNPDHAKFVDPDFYIRCELSLRDYVDAALSDGDVMIYKKCNLGFEGLEFGPTGAQTFGPETMNGPNVEFSEDTRQWVRDNFKGISDTSILRDEDISRDQMAWYNQPIRTFYRDDERQARNSQISKGADISQKTNQECAVSAQYIKNNDAYIFPSQEEQDRWGLMSKNHYGNHANVPKDAYTWKPENPDPAVIVPLLRTLVAKYWPDVKSDWEEMKNKNTGVDTFRHHQYRISPPEITQEKIVYILNAILAGESNVAQFEPDDDGRLKPIIRYNPPTSKREESYDVGIAQINTMGGYLYNRETVRRAAWDWKYCLEQGVKAFAWVYNYALQNASAKNPDAGKNPLDWAISSYNKGFGFMLDGREPTNDPYYLKVVEKFAEYLQNIATMGGTHNELYNQNAAKQAGVINLEFENLMRVFTQFRERYKEVNDRGSILAEESFFAGTRDISMGYDWYKSGGLTSEGKFYSRKYRLLFPNPGGSYKTMEYNPFWGKEQYSAGGGRGSDGGGGYDDYKDERKDIFALLVMDQGEELYSSEYRDGIMKSTAIAEDYNAFIPREALEYRLWVRATEEKQDLNPKNYFITIYHGAADKIIDLYNKAGKDIKLIDKNEIDRTYRIESFSNTDAVNANIAAIQKDESLESITGMVHKDIAKSYYNSFADMLQYDHTGRLIRAFPTFQMFIIDEGKWMAWHKMWDNFYGYNSIVSIDVIKDRRIGADTAVIELTNIYHNLSTYDNEINYGEWDGTFADIARFGSEESNKAWRMLWGAAEDLGTLRSRRDLVNTMVLSAGARIHLRIGYGSNAYRLPITFNGRITELDTGEITTIVAQGDGLELSNKISMSPGTTTERGGLTSFLPFSGSWDISEPRSIICQIMTGTGPAGKNAWEKCINYISGGMFFKENPFGIVHFGQTAKLTFDAAFKAFDIFGVMDDYGEVGSNIYSGSGEQNITQWIYTSGEVDAEKVAINWTPYNVGQGNSSRDRTDAPDIKIDLFDKSAFDIVNALAAACPDYIATVLPFEFRSTLFFGKPWWGALDRYEYKYKYDPSMDLFIRVISGASRRTLSQVRLYESDMNIISNNIKATEQYMYNNVMGTFVGGKGAKKAAKTTRLIQVDADIDPDKQKTAIVPVNIIENWNLGGGWNIPARVANWALNMDKSSLYAEIAATSALRDYVKEMYQDYLIVMGDPSVKPYDFMYMNDTYTGMKGPAWVKRVIHSFSVDTGFITSISPDCISLVDDPEASSMIDWKVALIASVSAHYFGKRVAKKMWRRIWMSPVGHLLKIFGAKATDIILNTFIGEMAGANHVEKIMLRAMGNKIRGHIVDIGTGRGIAKTKAAKQTFNEIVNFIDLDYLTDSEVRDLAEFLARNGNPDLAKLPITRKLPAISKTGEVIEGVLDSGPLKTKLKNLNKITMKPADLRVELKNIFKNTDSYKKVVTSNTGEKVIRVLNNIGDLLNEGTRDEVIDKLWHDNLNVWQPSWVKNGENTRFVFAKNAEKTFSKKALDEAGKRAWKNGKLARMGKGSMRVGGKLVTKTASTGAALIRKGMLGLSALAAGSGPPGWVLLAAEVTIDIALMKIAGGLVESLSRGLKARQALQIVPLKYRGKPFVAGLKGHEGSVRGDDPSALDKTLSGHGWASGVISAAYSFLGVKVPDYSGKDTPEK